MPGPERAIWFLLLGGAVAAALLIAFARNTDDGVGDTRTVAETPAQTTSTGERARTTTQPADTSQGGGIKSCRAIPIPQDPPKPITCRTSTATLTIAGEGGALLLGGTQVRVLEATVAGRTVRTRLRLRNETGAEQGVQAGGLELYLNIANMRVDPKPPADIRIADKSGKTIDLEYELTPAKLLRLRENELRAEVGVKPWDEESRKGRVVGVVRVRVRSTTA